MILLAIEIRSNAPKIGIIRQDLIHMSEPVETSELVAFTRTVDAKSLSRAAAELRVPRATVSRRLARLEERLGARLLRRTTRSLVLTEVGEVFYRQACIALDAVRLAEQSVRKADDLVRGDLRVSVPPIMSVSFHAMLCEFAMRYPALRVHVHTSNQHVDILNGGYDVALRASSQIQPGLIARTLFRDPMIAVAAPAYLADRGVRHAISRPTAVFLASRAASCRSPTGPWSREASSTSTVLSSRTTSPCCATPP